jgi:hypothetical protein
VEICKADKSNCIACRGIEVTHIVAQACESIHIIGLSSAIVISIHALR